MIHKPVKGKGGRIKWRNEFYVSIYEFAKQGMKLGQIASALGVKPHTLKEWANDDPAVTDAMRRGKESLTKKSGTATFLDYVYNRLPDDLQEVWTELDAMKHEPNGEKRIDLILEGRGTKQMQTLFVHALISVNFNSAEACRRINLPYITLQKWKERDPDFIGLMDTIQEMKKDFCEGALMGLVASADTSAVLFANRTLNRDRGYDPKITVEHTGRVHHQMDLTSLGLPPDVMRIILDAARKQREALERGPEDRVKVLPAAKVQTEDDEELMELEELK